MPATETPRCIVGAVDRICFIRWSKRPTVDEVDAVVDAVMEARRAVGRSLLLFAIVGANGDPPEPSAALQMVRKAGRIDRAIDSGITVLEGAGTPTRLLRGSMQAIAAVLMKPWMFVDDCELGLRRACQKADLDFANVRAEAIARGLFPA